MQARKTIVISVTAGLLLTGGGPKAWADAATEGAVQPLPERPVGLVQPLYVSPAGEIEGSIAQRSFAEAVKGMGLLPLETVDAAAPAPSTAPAMLREAVMVTRKLDFERALKLLDQAASEAETRGGAGLSPSELAQLYFHRAWAVERGDWKEEAAPLDDKTRERAGADYLRAAILQPGLTPNARDVPPRVIESWKRAQNDAAARPRASLQVNAPLGAFVAVDGGAAIPAPATVNGLVQGWHLVRVEEIGRAMWSTSVEVTSPRTELNVPARDAVTLPAADAARRARRMGARWAVVAEPRLREGHLILELRLIDTSGGIVSTGFARISGEPGSAAAGVLDLVNEARRLDLAVGPMPTPVSAALPPPAPKPAPLSAAPQERAMFGENPGLWARQHWPLLTAVGVALTTALILGIAISADDSGR